MIFTSMEGYLNASRIPPGQAWNSELAEKHYCILLYMSLVGAVGIVGMDDLFLSVGLVHLFGLVNLFSSGSFDLRDRPGKVISRTALLHFMLYVIGGLCWNSWYS